MDPEEHHGHESDCGRDLEEEHGPAGLRRVDAVRAQAAIKERRVEAGAQADGEGEPGVLERPDEGEVHELGENERDDADLHRRADVLARVEPGREDLHEDHADQADAISNHGLAGHPGVFRREATVVEECSNQRNGEHRERGRGRHREQDREAQAPVEELGVFRMICGGVVFRETGQEDRAERDAQHARRKFHQAIGVVEPGDAARDEEGREDRVDEERHLADRHAEGRGRHQLEDAPHARMREIEPPSRQKSHA